MILLDTHVLVMLALKPERLSRSAARVIAGAEAGEGIAIASIALWEIALLIDAGRVLVRGSPEAFLKLILQRPRLLVLDLSPEIAALAFQFPPDFPNDPADRIIAATARAHGLPSSPRISVCRPALSCKQFGESRTGNNRHMAIVSQSESNRGRTTQNHSIKRDEHQ